jgi:sugar lactone lactonase YvrE
MIRTTYALALALAIALCLPGLGVVHAATPSIRSIGPSVVSVGDPDFSLRVLGDNFDKGAVVLLDGQPLQTQFVTKKRLHGLVPVDVMDQTGTHTVAVRNEDGSTTGTETFTVGQKAAGVTIERINPDSLGVLTTGISAEFRLAGEGFTESSKVLVFGKEFDSTLREKGVLSVILPPEIIGVAALVPFQVKNASGLSNLVTVPIYDKAASVSSLDPGSVKAGAEAFTLTINGSGFAQDAVVRINGVDLVPTSIKSQQIKVLVPASVVAGEAQLPVYVVQSTGLSNVFILRVTPANGAPIIYDVSPDQVQAGAGAVRIELTGANFAEKSKVLVNGEEVSTNFVGRGNVTFKLTAAQTGTAGVTYQIQVRNNDGTVTNVVSVSVVPAAVVSTLSGKKLDGFEDGGPDSAKFRRPSRMALGPDGLIYVADQLNNAIRRLNPATGFVETLAGDGLPGYVDSGDSDKPGFDEPRFNNPLGVAVAEDGTIYVSDYGNDVIRRVRRSGTGYTVDTVAGANEEIKEAETRNELHSTRRGLQGFSDGAGVKARFRGIDGMALASDGTLYIADSLNQYIRALDTTSPSFTVSTVSGLGISGFTDGDRTTARYTLPVDVALDPTETSLYVADFGNNRVRLLDLATGSVTTFAGSGFEGVQSGDPLAAAFEGPIGVAVRPDGTVFVSDHFSDTIRRITPDGITTTLAGGGAKNKFKDGIGPLANFKDPRGILYDPALDALFVADQGHQRIRKIAV